jgi:hypothetical protein
MHLGPWDGMLNRGELMGDDKEAAALLDFCDKTTVVVFIVVAIFGILFTQIPNPRLK